jgi:hypothetical protein
LGEDQGCGSGVAIGRNPHNARHLREGLLVAPLGSEAMLDWGIYIVLIAPRSAERPVVKEFVAWLRDEIRQDAEADERKALIGAGRSGLPRRPARALVAIVRESLANVRFAPCGWRAHRRRSGGTCGMLSCQIGPFSFSRCSVACVLLQQRCNTAAEQGQGPD